MKKSILFLLLLTGIIFSACSTSKQASFKELFNTTWELEYITGSRIAFNGLYPNKKPQITFDETTNQVSGTASCNGYTAPYTINKNNITFGEPGPTTMMYCEGGGEQAFLEMMRKVTSFSIENDRLSLIVDDLPVMRFKKVTTEPQMNN